MGAMISALLVVLGTASGVRGAGDISQPSLPVAIYDDWAAQEARWGREPDDPGAVRDALARAQQLQEDLRRRPETADMQIQAEKLARLRHRVAGVELLDPPMRRSLYRQIRGVTRQIALANPLLADRPMLFMKRHRFICQMLHEYIGYYYGYFGLAGGGLYVLPHPGRSWDVHDLIDGRLPAGAYATPALSYDARTVYFAFTPVDQAVRNATAGPDYTQLPPSGQVPGRWNYFSSQRSYFHIYAVNTDGSNLRQLTAGPHDDFSPCPLPGGDLVFLSTRRGGFCRCGGDWEPVPTYTLHRMDDSGANLQTLSFHETNEWHPAVMSDGRIVYSRWDYVDRSAANFHGLWITNPDGTNPRILFGNYTKRINACYQPRPIPGSHRIAFIAGAHHAVVGGALAIVDPGRVGLQATSGEDDYEAIEVLTPEIGFPEAPGWPSSYFHSPWPLSDDYFLMAFSFQPLPGMGSGVKDDTETGIYYFDRFGNLELLYRHAGIPCVSPMPLAARPKPPVMAETADTDAAMGDEGEFIVTDVRWSLMPLPSRRPIRALRVFQVLPKTNHVANQPRIGYANAEGARTLLGTVPVEEDGSAYFRAPARKPLYFQLVDDRGHAVQGMRSVTYLQPGERRGCVGCHEPPNLAPPSRSLRALGRAPSRIQPGPDGTRPFCYPRLIQPVLEGNCIRCHDGSEGPQKSAVVLTGQPAGSFTQSYESLRPFVRWYEWGGASISQVITRPGQMGADASPLMRVLEDENHRGVVRLSESARRRICLWLDGNAPFYGTYDAEEQEAQRQARQVPPARLQ
jgi:hypothetical protein